MEQINATIFLESIPDGIHVIFTAIPDGTTAIEVKAWDTTDEYSFNPPTEVLIQGTDLERLMETGTIIFPFTIQGHEYTFTTTTYFDEKRYDGEEINIAADYTGILLVNEVSLLETETRSVLTLSQEPEFSSVMQFASPKYQYKAVSLKTHTASYDENTEETAWGFDLEKMKFPVDAVISTYVTAYCNIIHENLVWNVGLGFANTITNIQKNTQDDLEQSSPCPKIFPFPSVFK